jgi:molybdopterin-binding protein
MKQLNLMLLIIAGIFFYNSAASQNVMINILTQKSGVVRRGGTVFLEVTINNTDPANHVGIYKLKAQISVPSVIASIPATGHVLPTGWIITGNSGSTINLSNGKDMIAAFDARTLLIAIEGKAAGGPSTVAAQLSFSDGIAPGTAPGTLPGENPADNSSTSTIKVHK